MKLRNVMFGLVIALAVSCGSKETKENDTVATDSTATEAVETKAPASVKETLTKVWVVDDINYNVGLNASKDKEAYKAQLEKVLADMKGKSELNLGADGKVTVEMMDHTNTIKNYTGTWSLTDEDKTLNVMPEGALDPFQWTIWEISPESLSLLINNTTMKFVPKK